MRRVGITGVGQISEPAVHTALEDLIFEANTAALAQAELGLDDVQGVVTACSDMVDGRAISSMVTSGASGGHLKDEVNLASSAAHALVLGYLTVVSGRHDRVLVSSWGKASEGEPLVVEHLAAEPYFDRHSGLTSLSAMAIQAGARRAARRGGESADAHDVVARNRERAARNPNAPMAVAASAAEIAASPVVATPLTELEVAPVCDGAYAFVLEAYEENDRHGPGVEMAGVGWCADVYRLSDRDLVGVPHLRHAAEMACKHADVTHLDQDVGLFELHDYCGDAQLIAEDALGIRSKVDPQRINAWGGSMGGEAPFGGPLRRVAEVCSGLGDATPVIDEFGSALVQLTAGFAGQFQTVFILRSKA